MRNCHWVRLIVLNQTLNFKSNYCTIRRSVWSWHQFWIQFYFNLLHKEKNQLQTWNVNYVEIQNPDCVQFENISELLWLWLEVSQGNINQREESIEALFTIIFAFLPSLTQHQGWIEKYKSMRWESNTGQLVHT